MTLEAIIAKGFRYGEPFDAARIKAALERADWEEDSEDDTQEVRRVWLGTIFGITPSGKFYQPFACSNVDACPACKGSGSLKPRTGKRARARAARRQRDYARRTIALGSAYSVAGRAYCERVQARRERDFRIASCTCETCGGLGSHEAHRDELYQAALEALAESIGAYVWHCDDSIFICQSRERAGHDDDCGCVECDHSFDLDVEAS